MTRSQLAFLSSVPLFANAPPSLLREIGRDFHLRTYASNSILFLEGEEPTAFYIVAAGRVRLYKMSPEGREQTILMLHERDLFDVPPLLDHEPHPASAAALTDVRLYVIDNQEMQTMLQRYPELAGSLLPYMAQKLRQLASLASDLAFTDVSTRLARLILLYAQEEGELTPHGIDLAWGLSHRQIAQIIGTAREVVSRSMRHFEQQGVLHRGEHNHLIIDNWRKLLALAHAASENGERGELGLGF
ncbi:MAG: Crp/Fnr family transcriptional regulator [Chloroflexi bacterium]|nr:Crp/Fnr family transcriptional regulator [Chloroflexota bacterium]